MSPVFMASSCCQIDASNLVYGLRLMITSWFCLLFEWYEEYNLIFFTVIVFISLKFCLLYILVLTRKSNISCTKCWYVCL